MTENTESGNVPQVYGVSRWDYPKFYYCDHNGYNGCDKAAKIYYRPFKGLEEFGLVDTHEADRAHNCCGQHDKKEGLE